MKHIVWASKTFNSKQELDLAWDTLFHSLQQYSTLHPKVMKEGV